MPEVIDPTKSTLAQKLASMRPANEGELKAMQAGTMPPKQPVEPTPLAATPTPAATPKPAEPKPAPAATASDPDAEILSGKRSPKGDDFKRVKHAAEEAAKERDALKAKTGEYEKELGELRKRPVHNADLIKKIEAERDELKAKWQTVAAQFDGGFLTKYEAKVSEAIGKIKDAVPVDRIDKISQLLQMPESDWKRRAMAELTEDLDAPTITDIMIANREVRDILAARKKELEDSGNILKTSAEQRQKEQQERRTAYEKSFESVLSAKSKGDDALPVLQTRDGDTPEVRAWNDAVAERSKVAKAIFMDEFDSPEEKAEASIWAASAKGFLEELKATQAKLAAAEATLAKLHSSSPTITTAQKDSGDGGRKMTFTERMVANAVQ